MVQTEVHPKLTFYIGTHHGDFRSKLKTQLSQLDKNNIEYVIFEREDKLLPVLCTAGHCVAGLPKIKTHLKIIQTNSR